MHESAENHRLVAAAYRQAGVLDFAFRHFQRAVVLEPATPSPTTAWRASGATGACPTWR